MFLLYMVPAFEIIPLCIYLTKLQFGGVKCLKLGMSYFNTRVYLQMKKRKRKKWQESSIFSWFGGYTGIIYFYLLSRKLDSLFLTQTLEKESPHCHSEHFPFILNIISWNVYLNICACCGKSAACRCASLSRHVEYRSRRK